MQLGAGHPMGPLTLCDFVGLDVLLAVCDSLYDEFHKPEYAAPPLLKRMVVAGRHGRKTGRGFYEYAQARGGGDRVSVTDSAAAQYALTEQQRDFQDVIRDVVAARIAPRAAEIDATGEFPQDVRAGARRAGPARVCRSRSVTAVPAPAR